MKTANNNITMMLRHVVLFKFYDNAEEAIIKEIEMKFDSLKHQIAKIKDFEYGTNISKEGLNNGYTHCFMLSFESENNRDEYIEHQAHQAFTKFIKPYLESVCVFDYWN